MHEVSGSIPLFSIWRERRTIIFTYVRVGAILHG
jgi:hypothetical protein